MADPLTFTVSELARRWRCRRSTIRSWIRNGALRAFDVSRDGRGQRWRVSWDAVAAFEAERQAGQPAGPARRRRRKAEEGLVQYF